jgi:methyl-accepting chemotaxis protein
VVQLVDKPDELFPALDQMGQSHVGYGVTADMYPFVSYSLLHTLAGYFGEQWTAEMATTWGEAMDVVSARMITAQEAAA